MKHTEPHPFHAKNPDKFPPQMEWHAVHEVYYDDRGEPNGWGTEPVSLISEDASEFKAILAMMLEACDKPVLDYNSEKIVVEVERSGLHDDEIWTQHG